MSEPRVALDESTGQIVVGQVLENATTRFRHARDTEAVCDSVWESWRCTRPELHPGLHEAGTFIGRDVVQRVAARWSR